jgi:hypothetical protein
MNATSRVQYAFGALVLAQALHSTEEIIGRLWETFPPARFVSGLVSNDLASGFLFLNVCIVAFGALCYVICSGGSLPLQSCWCSQSGWRTPGG